MHAYNGVLTILG